MGGQIENKERKSVGLRREKQERGKKEKRKVRVLTQGDVQGGYLRGCSKEMFVFLQGRKEGSIEIVIKM